MSGETKITPRVRCRPAWALVALMAAAFGARMALAVMVFTSTRDTSTVGIMARQILEGSRPLFYAGQDYMGAFEAYAVALVFFFLGASPETLAIVPSFFAALWVGALYLLFRDLFRSPAAGFGAAACAAFGGWYTVWYTMGAYGGYPEIYLAGVIALWLALRETEMTAPDFRPLPWTGLGLVLAFGVWTNLQVLPFFLTAALWLAVDWWRVRRRSWRRGGALVLAAGIGLLGLIPYAFVESGEGAEMVRVMWPRIQLVYPHLAILWERNLPAFLWWPDTTSVFARTATAVVVALPILFYLYSVAQPSCEGRRRVPLLFAGLFLLLYLTHPMAGLFAPRYLITLGVIVMGAGFASMLSAHRVAVRRVGWVCLVLWSGYNLGGLVHRCLVYAPDKAVTMELREEIIANAEEAGSPYVKIVGALPDQLMGLQLSFTAGERAAFLEFRDGRILEHHREWARKENSAYGFRPGLTHYFTGALQALGIETYRLIPHPVLTLLGDMRPVHSRRRSAPVIRVDAEGVHGAGESLTDRRADTGISPSGAVQRVTMKLDQPRMIDGMRFYPAGDDLPRGPYDIAVSVDGDHYEPVVTDLVRVGESYVNGNRVYFKDHYPAQDHRWSPVEAAYVQFTHRGAEDAASWSISEVFVFEYHGHIDPVSHAEVSGIHTYLADNDVEFAWCDRWLSRRLESVGRERGRLIETLPAENARYPHTLPERTISGRAGEAIIVERALADDMMGVFGAAGFSSDALHYEVFEHYAVFLFSTGSGDSDRTVEPLYWNGHIALLKTEL